MAKHISLTVKECEDALRVFDPKKFDYCAVFLSVLFYFSEDPRCFRESIE